MKSGSDQGLHSKAKKTDVGVHKFVVTSDSYLHPHVHKLHQIPPVKIPAWADFCSVSRALSVQSNNLPSSLHRRDWTTTHLVYLYIPRVPTSLLFRVMPHSRPRRHHQLAKISEESMTVDERERQPLLLQQVKSREDVYQDADLPEDWCFAYKWGIVALLAFMAFTV
jgi:hypothetical protein